MKASATVLCNNILLRANNEGIEITPMKLQKLMYYTCRDYAQKTGASPLGESFEVWQYGPVLPSVYSEFKAFRAEPIRGFAKDATGNSFRVSESENPILSEVLDLIWAKYKRLSGVDLSRMTHEAGSGWHEAYMRDSTEIALEDMVNDVSGK